MAENKGDTYNNAAFGYMLNKAGFSLDPSSFSLGVISEPQLRHYIVASTRAAYDDYHSGKLTEQTILDEAATPDGATDWCAAAASYGLKTASSDFPEHYGALALAREFGDYYIDGRAAQNYTPQAGDLMILYRGAGNTWKSHVGVIESVNPEANTMIVLEGNKTVPGQGATFARVEREISTGNILGFYNPDGTLTEHFQTQRLRGYVDTAAYYMEKNGIQATLETSPKYFASLELLDPSTPISFPTISFPKGVVVEKATEITAPDTSLPNKPASPELNFPSF